MKSFAVGILACLALGGTAVAADVPNMVDTWKPTGESAGAQMGFSHAGWAAALERRSLIPLHAPLSWSKNNVAHRH
jgi:opacity protein-like surface antigen